MVAELIEILGEWPLQAGGRRALQILGDRARCKYVVTVPSPIAHVRETARWLRSASYFRRRSSRTSSHQSIPRRRKITRIVIERVAG